MSAKKISKVPGRKGFQEQKGLKGIKGPGV